MPEMVRLTNTIPWKLYADAAGLIVVARSPVAAPVPGCIKGRVNPTEDDVNICCLKLKRDAENAAEDAADRSKLYEKAMAVREKLGDLVARDALPEALPGCQQKRTELSEDAVNICCLKLKREAEAAANAAADAYSSYGKMLEYRSL